MIGEARSGTSFQGLVHYMLHGSASTHAKTPAWVELRNLAGRDPDRVAVEMRSTAGQNARVKKPVYHLVLSPAPEDRLSRGDWVRIADRVLGDLGLSEHQVVMALHTDTGLPHLHLAINRVHPGTLRAWDRWQDRPRIEGVLRRVEREWGLRRVQGRLAEAGRSGEERGAGLSSGQKAQLRYRATEPQVVRWRRELGPHFEAARSWSDLAVRLEANQVRFEARGRGLVVTDGEVYAKASSIGREYSRGRLEARFGEGFAAWREARERFEAAAGVYARIGHRGVGDRRARRALGALRSAGKALGWRAAGRLAGPLAPAVGAVVRAGAREELRGVSGERGWEEVVSRRVGPSIARAGSWAEAEGRLRFHGVWIERARSGGHRGELVVTDGVRSRALGRIGAELREDRLVERLGSWDGWERTRGEVVGRARRLARFDVSDPARRERYKRLIGMIIESDRRVERYQELRHQYDRTEREVRRLVRPYLGKKASWEELNRTVWALRDLRSAHLRVDFWAIFADGSVL